MLSTARARTGAQTSAPEAPFWRFMKSMRSWRPEEGETRRVSTPDRMRATSRECAGAGELRWRRAWNWERWRGGSCDGSVVKMRASSVERSASAASAAAVVVVGLVVGTVTAVEAATVLMELHVGRTRIGEAGPVDGARTGRLLVVLGRRGGGSRGGGGGGGGRKALLGWANGGTL